MSTQIQLPTSNLVTGKPAPAADMDKIVTALTAMIAISWVYPTGDTSGNDDLANINAAITSNKTVIFAPGTYYINAALDWKTAGIIAIGAAGAANTIINQVTANTAILQVAAEGQYIRGLTLRYPAQQTSSQTAANGIEFGDDTAGSCFLSVFEDLRVYQSATGLIISPGITSAAGLFSCHFRNIEVFGYSISAINLNGGNGAGAGCTGCVFDNTYIHNNFSGTPVTSAYWPVIFRNWSEVVFNELNIEKCLIPSPAFQVAEVGNCVINSFHLEGIQAGGTNLALIGVGSQTGSLVINGLAVRFSTFTGSSSNAVIQATAGSGQTVQVNGFSMPTADGGDSTPSLALVDFNSINDVTVTVAAVNPLGPLYSTISINPGTGCQVQVGNVAGFLCPPVSYAPGSRATKNTTSTTMAAVDSTDINTGSFQAPASGSVVVEASFVAGLGTSGDHMAFAVAAHGTVTPLLSNVSVWANAAALNPYAPRFLVTDLTPGGNYNLDLLFSSPDGASLTVYALGETGVTPSATGGAPVVMSVRAV